LTRLASASRQPGLVVRLEPDRVQDREISGADPNVLAWARSSCTLGKTARIGSHSSAESSRS